MRVLLIDIQGNCVDFAMRCMSAGHQVKYYFPQTEKTKYTGKGLVERIDDYREWRKWPDIVILGDNTRYLKDMDAWRRDNIKVIGATCDSAQWEIDRKVGQVVFKKAGIDTIPYKEFSDYDTAISYVKREMRRFVSKPCGDEEDKSLSYVSKSPADMVYMLERWKKQGRHKDSFILQEFVPGIEMAVGCWFGPDGFNEGWCENWEEKNLMAGGTGPATGEMGTTLRYVKRSKLADLVLKPLEDLLDETGHTGYVDVNCIIDEDGKPWPLEFTTRLGWPTFNIQQELHKGDPLEWLVELAHGNDSREFSMNSVAIGVLLAVPDFPYSSWTRKDVVGAPLSPISKEQSRHIHPCEIMAGEAPIQVNGKIVTAPCLVTAGDYVLVATGTGKTVLEARKQAYRIVSKIDIPSSPFYRPDIGLRLKKQLPELQRHGYATAMSF